MLGARPRRGLTPLCRKHSGAGLPAAVHPFPPCVLRSPAPTWPQTPSGGAVRQWAKQNPHPGDHVILYRMTHQLTPSFIHSCPHSVTHSFIHSLIHSFTRSFIHSFTHSLTHLFSSTLTHSLTHSFVPFHTHSFTPSYMSTSFFLLIVKAPLVVSLKTESNVFLHDDTAPQLCFLELLYQSDVVFAVG